MYSSDIDRISQGMCHLDQIEMKVTLWIARWPFSRKEWIWERSPTLIEWTGGSWGVKSWKRWLWKDQRQQRDSETKCYTSEVEHERSKRWLCGGHKAKHVDTLTWISNFLWRVKGVLLSNGMKTFLRTVNHSAIVFDTRDSLGCQDMALLWPKVLSCPCSQTKADNLNSSVIKMSLISRLLSGQTDRPFNVRERGRWSRNVHKADTRCLQTPISSSQ